jgi:hypothetical protein
MAAMGDGHKRPLLLLFTIATHLLIYVDCSTTSIGASTYLSQDSIPSPSRYKNDNFGDMEDDAWYDDVYGTTSRSTSTWVTTIPASWVVASTRTTTVTTRTVPDDIPDDDIVIQPPRIHIQDMASALDWTSRMNYRLQLSTIIDPVSLLHQYQRQEQLESWDASSKTSGGGGGGFDHLRGGGSVEPMKSSTPSQQPYRIPLSRRIDHLDRADDEATTIFHTSRVDDGHDDNLQEFLVRVLDVLKDELDLPDDAHELDLDATALERTLTMLYLDRACSVTSPQKLPFCTPQTVHYLSITAMLVAAGAVRGDLSCTTVGSFSNELMSKLYSKLEVVMGIPVADSQRRVASMLAALKRRDSYDDDDDDDESGIFVTPMALLEWKKQWEARFLSPSEV